MRRLGLKAKPGRTLQMNSFFRVKHWTDNNDYFYLNDETKALLLGTHDGGIEEAFAFTEKVTQAEPESLAAESATPQHLNSADVLLPAASKVKTLLAPFFLKGQRNQD